MDGHELAVRLHAVKLRKTDLAARLGLAIQTIYHWKEVPEYVVEYLRVLERLVKLGEKA